MNLNDREELPEEPPALFGYVYRERRRFDEGFSHHSVVYILEAHADEVAKVQEVNLSHMRGVTVQQVKELLLVLRSDWDLKSAKRSQELVLINLDLIIPALELEVGDAKQG